VNRPSFDFETAAVGAVLLEPQAFWRCADAVNADDFADPVCRRLWALISELAQAKQPYDYITISERDPSLGREAASIVNATPSAVNARVYAQGVAKRATSRRVRLAGEQIARLSGDDVVVQAQRLIGECVPRAESPIRPISYYVSEAYRELAERHEAEDAISGIPSGIESLDAMTGGFQDGDLIIVGARPSVGKTALSLQWAIHAAELKRRPLFVSLEMRGIRIAQRALAHVGHINPLHLAQPKQLEDGEWPRLTSAVTYLRELPLMLDQQSGLTVEALSARARQLHAQDGLDMIVIDYLTYLTPPRAESVAAGVQQMTRSLKALAIDLNVPIILLSQLNRDGDNRPTLTSLRESGAIEQDADVVILLSRPDSSKHHLVLADLKKQRNGPVGEVWLHARMDRMRFVETDERPTASGGGEGKRERKFAKNAPPRTEAA
jgi:replicative DNA helicase